MGKDEKIHLTRSTLGEKLLEGLARSSAGFLIRTTILEIEVDQEIVRNETKRLQRLAVVAYFVGRRQDPAALKSWIAAIQS